MTRIHKYLSLMTMAFMAVSTHVWAASETKADDASAAGPVPPAASAAPVAPSAREAARAVLLDLRNREDAAAAAPGARAAAATESADRAVSLKDTIAAGVGVASPSEHIWEVYGRQTQARQRQRDATETATAAAAGAGAAAPSRSRSESEEALQAALTASAAEAAAEEEDERLVALALAASLGDASAAAASGDTRLPGMDLVDALHASLVDVGVLPLAAPVAPSAPPADIATRPVGAGAGAGAAPDEEWFVVNTFRTGSVSKFVAKGSGTLNIEAAPDDAAQIKAKRSAKPGAGVKCEVLNGILTITNSDASDTGGYVVMLPAATPMEIQGSGTVNLKGLTGTVDVEGQDITFNVDAALKKLSVKADSAKGTIQNLAGDMPTDMHIINATVNNLTFGWDARPLAMRRLTFMGDTLNATVEAPEGTKVSGDSLVIAVETSERSRELPSSAYPDINVIGDCGKGTFTVKKCVDTAAAEATAPSAVAAVATAAAAGAGAGGTSTRPRSGTDEEMAAALAASLLP